MEHSASGQEKKATMKAMSPEMDIGRLPDEWSRLMPHGQPQKIPSGVLDQLRLGRSGEIDMDENTINQVVERYSQGPTLMSSLLLYFDGEDWNYHLLQDHDTIVLAFQGHNGEWNCIAQVRTKQQQIVFYSAYEDAVPEERRAAVTDLLTRINYQLVFGAFELDMDDGELNFRTAIDADGIIPETRLIRNMVHTNIVTMDRYIPALRAVISGAEPARALTHLDAQD